jgi:hypothetical protein
VGGVGGSAPTLCRSRGFLPTPPHQPIEAFGREASPPHRLTDWPPTHPLGPHCTPPLPRLSGAAGEGTGRGFFRVQRVPIRCCPRYLHPFWGPLPVDRRGNFPIAVRAGSRIFVVEIDRKSGRMYSWRPGGAAFLFGCFSPASLFHEFSQRFSGEVLGGPVSLSV